MNGKTRERYRKFGRADFVVLENPRRYVFVRSSQADQEIERALRACPALPPDPAAARLPAPPGVTESPPPAVAVAELPSPRDLDLRAAPPPAEKKPATARGWYRHSERARKDVTLTLSDEARAALARIAGPRERSGVVERLVLTEDRRKRKRETKRRKMPPLNPEKSR